MTQIDLSYLFVFHSQMLKSKCNVYGYYIKDLLMKGATSLNYLINPQSIHKYIPTPEAKEIILSYFVYNNFQDFNTWQQIAKTKIQYDYIENHKGMIVCKVILKWQEKGFPTIIESSEAKNRKNAKKRVLKKLIENIIFQGLIAYGFKEDNFVDKLPRRRKNESDVSSDEIQQQKCHNKSLIKQILNEGNYIEAFNILTFENAYEFWNYGLKLQSIKFCENVINKLKYGKLKYDNDLRETKELIVEESPLRQFYYQKQSKDPFQEDLADFIRYYQFQRSKDMKGFESKQIQYNFSTLPSEDVLFKSKRYPPTQQEMFSYFHPIEGRKIFFNHRIQNSKSFLGDFQNIPIPKFQSDDNNIPLKLIEKFYELVFYYCHNYEFCIRIIQMMAQQIKNTTILFDASTKMKYRQQGEQYYLKHKNLLTAQFLYLLHKKIDLKYLSIQGILISFQNQDSIFTFNCKEPEQILNKKINKRANLNEFEQMLEISPNEYVLLISKFNYQEQYIGQILQINPIIKIYVPAITEQIDPSPFTMYKLYNSKIFEKSSSAIIQTAKNCMALFDLNTHLIFQPPTFPHLSLIFELLLEWTSNKCSVLIISLHFEILHTELTALGFKILKVTSKLEEKYIPKFNIVCSSPNGVCCDLLKNCAFIRVLIDGAHQISQIVSLPAIVKGCKQLYLLGDPHMPEMSAISKYCNDRGMSISIFQRLMETKKPISFISQIQKNYGDKAILEWVNDRFYNKQLMFFGENQKTPFIKGFPWPSNDYRVCFLQHKYKHNDLNEYINEQAFICSVICAQIVKSGYTKIQQITCSTVDHRIIGVLRQYFLQLLKTMQIKDIRLLGKLVERFARLASGSFYNRSDLSILMLGADKNVNIKYIIAALSEGKRGVIIIGDITKLEESPDWNDFFIWCQTRKLILELSFK